MNTFKRPVFRPWPAVVLLAASVLPGQTPASPTPSGGKIHLLKITVLDAATKQPVVGAAVESWEGRDVPKAITDAAGVATLTVPIDVTYAEQMQRFNAVVTDPRYVTRSVMWVATAGRVRDTLPASYELLLSPGVTVGGVVRDERGAPIVGAKIIARGSGYQGFRLGGDEKLRQEYSSVSMGDTMAPLTDAQGAWRLEHFPAELTQVTITVVRPGGAQAQFDAGREFRMPDERSTDFKVSELIAGKLSLVLKDGQTVRGVVVDEAGKALAGAQLRAREAAGRGQPHLFAADREGKFELPNWDGSRVLITAESPGHSTHSVIVPVTADLGTTRIMLPPAKPLRLRVVGDNGAPLAGAELQCDPNPGEQILSWKATTDAEGRVAWETAPDAPVTIWVTPPPESGYPHRTARLVADGTEQMLRLRKGADKSVVVHLRVVDAQSGAPLPSFEVWRRLPNTAFAPWGAPSEKGEFRQELAAAELPKGIVPSYRLQVRAAGYAGWASETLDFSNGDQDLTIKLAKGESTLANEPPPSRGTRPVWSGDNNPALKVLAASVGQLLQSGDVGAFVRATHATAPEWDALVPKNAMGAEGPLGANSARILSRREKDITASATHVVEIAKKAGLVPGTMRFEVKSIASAEATSSVYTFGGQRVNVPHAASLRVALVGEPVEGAGAAARLGEYVLSMGDAHQLPAGWRIEGGVRWVSLPTGLLDEGTLRELRLVSAVAPTSMMDRRTLSGADDAALLAFGGTVADLIRARAPEAFLAAATFSREKLVEFVKRNGWGSEKDAEEIYTRTVTGLTASAQGVVALQERIGADFSDAKVTVKQVLLERPRFTHFGELEGIRGEPMRVTLAVESPRSTKSGRPLAGNYTIALGDALRAGDRWLLLGEKMRWQEFPKGLLTDDDMKAVEFENYVAEHMALPPGHPAPEIEMIKLADEARVSLSALRGKVVVLEFWATWCGPCQEPMEKLQHLREAHPDWMDRVEIVALSIDDKAVTARAHLEKKGWDKTSNLWAGDGGFGAAPAKAFRLRGVPTAYVLGRDGKVVQAGHPMSMDFGSIVDAQLRR